jgi:hypothetical protein
VKRLREGFRPIALVVASLLWASAPALLADLAGAASSAELATRYSQALERKDTNAYALLVCWDRVLPQERTSLVSGFASEASGNVTDVRFLTVEQMDQAVRNAGGVTPTRTPVKRAGATFDFNLPVIGYLAYQFKSRDDKSHGTIAIPVGMKSGRYFITTRAPVP